MREYKLNKSLFYKDIAREEVGFYVEGNKEKKITLGFDQDKYGRSRDYANCINDIAPINEEAREAYESFDATLYSTSNQANQKIEEYIASTSYGIDEEKLSKELEAFVENREKINDAWYFQYCLSDIRKISATDLEGLTPEAKDNCLGYIKDAIDECIEPSGKKVKSINARRSFMERVTGKNIVHEMPFSNVAHGVRRLSETKYIDEIKELYEEGFPDIAKVDEKRNTCSEEIKELSYVFPFKREDELRTSMLKLYGKEHIRGAMRLKYYEETKDLTIFMSEKEIEKFKAMSFSELKEAYGTELVTTHMGAVLATLKLHQEKEEGKDLKASLASFDELITKAKIEEANFDINIRRYIFDEIQKDYQKFSTYDMEYRKIVKNLAPTDIERGTVKYFATNIKGKEGDEAHSTLIERLHERVEMHERFIHDSEIIITGKIAKSDLEETKARITGKKKEETVSQAIRRVKEKHKQDRATGENISGVVIADDFAERLQEGFEVSQDREKRQAVATNLRKKRTTTR